MSNTSKVSMFDRMRRMLEQLAQQKGWDLGEPDTWKQITSKDIANAGVTLLTESFRSSVYNYAPSHYSHLQGKDMLRHFHICKHSDDVINILPQWLRGTPWKAELLTTLYPDLAEEIAVQTAAPLEDEVSLSKVSCS